MKKIGAYAFILISTFSCEPVFAASKSLSLQNTNEFVVSSDSLRRQLLEGNIPIKIALNRVTTAKTQVWNQRMALLPSVNLGAMTGGPAGFAMANATLLLPFLLPSNWFNLAESKFLFKAEEQGFYALQLNTYASALALYYTLIADRDLQKALLQQYENLKQVEAVVRSQFDLGLVPESDLQQATAQVQALQVQVSATTELNIQTNASIRQMLGLPLSVNLKYKDSHMEPVAEERNSPQILLNLALSVAPEKRQIRALIQAANEAKWSKAFSFLSGSSLNAQISSTNDVSAITKGSSVNLGFGIFTEVMLSNLKTEELKIQSQEIDLEQAKIVESTLGSINEAKIQVEMASAAENNFMKSYEAEVEKFRSGTTDLLHIATTSNFVTNASVNRIKAQKDLDTMRVSLIRILVKKQFAEIRPCTLEQVGEIKLKGPLSWIFNQFSAKSSLENNNVEFSMDQACKK